MVVIVGIGVISSLQGDIAYVPLQIIIGRPLRGQPQKIAIAPAGATANSPAIYRWEKTANHLVQAPAGAAEPWSMVQSTWDGGSFVPTGTFLPLARSQPSDKSLRYCLSPLPGLTKKDRHSPGRGDSQ
jgi:hypothetical protein